MSIPRMTRVREEIDEAISKYASERKWTISFAIAQILEDSPILSHYLSLEDKNREIA